LDLSERLLQRFDLELDFPVAPQISVALELKTPFALRCDLPLELSLSTK
jgi:hypothetical protein